MFQYNSTHQVVICEQCASCIVPGRSSQERHLRTKPHRLSGAILKTTVQQLESYSLRTIVELREYARLLLEPTKALDGLAIYTGFSCIQPDCRFRTRHLREVKKHIPAVHKISVTEHAKSPLWKNCKLQTYFTGKGLIDYFVVAEPSPSTSTAVDEPPVLTEAERAFFTKTEADFEKVKEEMAEQAGIVHEFEDSRASHIPWLERTGIIFHITGLPDSEIRSSYKLPRPQELADPSSGDAVLIRILNTTRSFLQEAYKLCDDTSPERKLTYQRACILNEFYLGASGKSRAFRHRKQPSSLTTYYDTWLQLVTFIYRVVYKTRVLGGDSPTDTSSIGEGRARNSHFHPADPLQPVPEDVIQLTDLQNDSLAEVSEAANRANDVEARDPTEDESIEAEVVLKCALRKLFIALICHIVGSAPFKSPILSFSAMLGRSVRGLLGRDGDKGKIVGSWKHPSVYSSHLSALTWVAQLLIFEYACFLKQDDEDHIPGLLSTLCSKFFQQKAESPFGYILQWRLYLFAATPGMLAAHQARWSDDKETVIYRSVELHMSHLPQLVLAEYKQAHSLLYEDLLLQAPGLVPMQAWKFKDDLDLIDFGESWLTSEKNEELLRSTETAILQQLQNSPQHRSVFLNQGRDGVVTFDPKAVEIYESKVQDFLKRLLILCHITAGQPLREPELLSIVWRNTSRQRHIMLWEKQVMIFTQYHKGQQQTETYKENIRFLPSAVGDLLLQYLAYVPSFRQVLLRQRTPKALLSAYLWSTLEGKVWPDGTISACLRRACARARIDRLHTLNWRHISAAICKEKFSAKEYTNFSTEDITAEEMEEESDLVSLALQSNHSYPTFNSTYAGSTMLTMDNLLHRNNRASKLWRDLFKFDTLLQGKRERAGSDVLSIRMLDDIKRGQQRKRVGYKEADLLTVARRVHSLSDLQFRAGQRDGLLAVLGPHRAEHVVVILGTGSGKTMLIILGVLLPDARTTILVVPLVALRNDLLGRFKIAGIKPLLWTSGLRRSASLVVVSVEAACSETFLSYARGLVTQQQLDRVIIDECHLTVTASDYRDSMVQLGWYIGKIKAQSVWLTATLPPSLQSTFLQQNKLLRPRIVRASTNRANIKYRITYRDPKQNLLKCAAELVQTLWSTDLFNHSRDKIIIYCNSKTDVASLGEILGCPTYTSESGTAEEKATIIQSWLATADQPVIVATTALGPGFDYPYICWVIHVDAPRRLTDFSQASGRAGRAGQPVFSTVLLHRTWQPSTVDYATPDHEAMDLYLTRKYCLRGILSQFLDAPGDWRWCMSEDEPCGVCKSAHSEPRPYGLVYTLDRVIARETDSSAEVFRQDYVQDQVLEQYERDLLVLRGTCLYCRALLRPFEHTAGSCHYRWDWINVKKEVLAACKRLKRDWVADYVACWKCFQPQSICRVADPDHTESVCQFPDLVLSKRLTWEQYCSHDICMWRWSKLLSGRLL
jgi:orsellinic acid/F9775 biosynthesis protein OrsD/helicase-like protein/RAD3-like DEAD/DEAH box helicase